MTYGLGLNPYEERPPEEELEVPPTAVAERPEPELELPIEPFTRILPQGKIYTVRDEVGKEHELHIFEDYEFIGTAPTLRSPNYNVYEKDKKVGVLDYKTGEFIPEDPKWWQTALKWTFAAPTITGMGIRQTLLAPELDEEGKERVEARTKAIMEEFDYPYGTAKELALGEVGKAEYEALPWWQQLLWELPFWAGLAVSGVSALKGFRAARALPTVARVPTQIVLAPMAGYEKAVAIGLKYGVGVPLKGISIASRKAFEKALDLGLDKWLVRQGIRGDQANKVVQYFLKVNNRWLYQQAETSVKKSLAKRIAATQAGRMAANDVVKAAEPMLRDAIKSVTGKELVPITPAAVKPLVVPPIKPPTITPPVTPVTPKVTAQLKEGSYYEGMLFGGSHDISRLRFAEKDAAIRKTIPATQKKYNEIRVSQGLEPVTDWIKRPDVTVEQKYREVLAIPKAEVTPPVSEGVVEKYKQDYRMWVESGYKGNPPRVPRGMSGDYASSIRLEASATPLAPEVAKPPMEPVISPIAEVLASTEQKARGHIVAQEKALVTATGKTTQQYRRLAQNVTGKKSMKDMTSEEASAFIDALEKYPDKKWSAKTGTWIPQPMPVTKAIVPENYFNLEFGEPTPIRYFTSQNFYATKLGVGELTQPLEVAKQKLDLVFPAWSKAIDLKIKALNKVYKVTSAEKLIAFRNNLPTRASAEMAKLLNQYEDLPANLVDELGDEKVALFSWFRNLSRTILNGQNQVRELLNMPPIPHREAYLRHIATETSREIWRGNYSLPSDLAYWSRRVVGKKVFNPMEIPRKMTDDLLEYFSKDLGYLTKSMIHTGLKEVYLSQPLKAFTTQLNVLSKGMMPFSSLSPTEMEKAQMVSVLPASTHKWLVDYVNQVIKGQQTELDASINRIITQSGIGGVFDKFLKEFGRSIGTRPVTKMAQFSGRLIISATIGTKPRQIIRNLFQSTQNLALYGIEPTLAAFLPAGKTLSRLLDNSMFLKSYARYEELPVGAMAKVERAWLWAYGKSAIFNARTGMKASFYGTIDYITNPKNKGLGWADPARTYTEPKGFLYDSESEKLLREMEFGAGATQYQYIGMGMPEVFRHKTLIPLTRLQSWWMNYFAKFNREALQRFWNGSVGWDKNLKIPPKARLNWMKYVILGGAVLTAMGYRRSFMRDVLPHWGSPALQCAIGAYDYVTADSDYERENAKKTMLYSFQAFIPGLIDYTMWKEVWEGERPLNSMFFYSEDYPPNMPTWGIPVLEEENEIKRQIEYINTEVPKFRGQLGTFIPAEDDIEGYTYEVSDLAVEIRALTRDIPPERLTEDNFLDIVLMYKKAETLWDKHYYSLPSSARQEWLQQDTPESIWVGAYLALWGKLKVTGWVSGNPQTIALIGQLMDEYNIPMDAVSGARDIPELQGRGVKPSRPLENIIDDFHSASGDKKFNFLEQATRQYGQLAVKDSLTTEEITEYTWDIRSFDWRKNGLLPNLVHWGNEFYKVFQWLSTEPSNSEQLLRVKQRVPEFDEVIAHLLPIYEAEPKEQFPKETWARLLQLAVSRYGAEELKRLVEQIGIPNQWDRIQAEIDRLSGEKPQAPAPRPREEGLGPNPFE